jgi:hypothetical protein
MKITAKRIPQRGERPDAHHRAEIGKADSLCQPEGRCFAAAQEGLFKRGVGTLGLRAKLAVTPTLIRPGEARDRVNARLNIGMEIKRFAVIPRMAREDIKRGELNALGKISTRLGKD